MNMTGWMLTFVVTALAGAVLVLGQAVLAPFLAGLILAYIISPMVGGMARYGVPRTIASAIPVALAIMVLSTVLVLGIPMLIDQLSEYVAKLPAYLTQLQQAVLPEKLARFFNPRAINSEAVFKFVGLVGSNGITWILANVQTFYSGALAIFHILMLVIMTPLVAFYLVHDWPELEPRLIKNLPKRWRAETMTMASEIDGKLSAYLRGQSLVCLSLAIYYAAAFHIMGLELGWILGIATGLLAFIPVVGAMMSLLLALIMVLVQFQFATLDPYVWLIAVFAIGQALEGSVLVPFLVGNRVGLHPVWVIFALLLGGEMAGILGMLLAVPIAAIISVILPRIIAAWHKTVG